MKNKNVALVLCLLTGALGGHHYYLGNWRKGVYRFLLTCLSIIIVLAFINEHINMLIPLACYIPLLIDFIRIAFDPKYIVNYKTINFKDDMKEAVKEEMQKKQCKSDKEYHIVLNVTVLVYMQKKEDGRLQQDLLVLAK